jgi:polyisoprenoid-binding protein YceI
MTRAWLGRALVAAAVAATVRPAVLPAQLEGPIPPMRLASGALSFDGHASVGDFTGSTTTVRGEMSGGETIAAVRGWVEAPVQTLETGNRKRDRDLNKSMESDRFPTMRFELTGVSPKQVTADSAAVDLLGKLTLHGVTREVTLPARILRASGGLRVRSSFPLDLGDYQIRGLTRMLGMLRMQERIEVHVILQFAP